MSTRIMLLAILMILACSVHAGAIRYKVGIEIRQKEGCSFLSIEYRNIGDEPMYFQPEEPAILLMDSRRKIMPFIGVVAKRRPYSVEEHIKLMPGGNFVSEINLNSSYGLKKKGSYVISVNTDYFDPVQLKGYQKGSVSTRFFYMGKCQPNERHF